MRARAGRLVARAEESVDLKDTEEEEKRVREEESALDEHRAVAQHEDADERRSRRRAAQRARGGVAKGWEQRAEGGGDCAQCEEVRAAVDVVLADLEEWLAAVVPRGPRGERDHELAERRVNVEEVRTAHVATGELTEMHLVEDQRVRGSEAPTEDRLGDGQQGQQRRSRARKKCE